MTLLEGGLIKVKKDLTRFVERLYDGLSRYNSSSSLPKPYDVLGLDSRKYYDQARNFEKVLILAAEGKPIPTFPIALSNLSPLLKKDLDDLKTRDLETVLRMAVLKIYKDIDNEYNQLFPGGPPIDKRLRINFSDQMTEILRVELIP